MPDHSSPGVTAYGECALMFMIMDTWFLARMRAMFKFRIVALHQENFAQSWVYNRIGTAGVIQFQSLILVVIIVRVLCAP